MNKNIIPILGAAALLAVATSPAGHAQVVTGSDYVRIEVRVQTEQERKPIKGTTTDTVTQGKILNITLSGKAKNPETRKATWQGYGRDAKDNAIVALESGEFPIDFTKGPQKVESKKITTTYTPEYSSGSGNRGRSGSGSRTSTKKVPAEGKKFAGYGVIVKDGEKIVGEYYDPPGLKAEAAK